MRNARFWLVMRLVVASFIVAGHAPAQPVHRSQPVFVKPPAVVPPPVRAPRALPANPGMAIPRAPVAQPAPAAPSTAHELTHVRQQESLRAQSASNVLNSRQDAEKNAVGNVK